MAPRWEQRRRMTSPLDKDQTMTLEEYKALQGQGKEPHTLHGEYFHSVKLKSDPVPLEEEVGYDYDYSVDYDEEDEF